MRDAVSNTPYMCLQYWNEHIGYIKYLIHLPPKYAWWFSHPPLWVESPASRLKMRVLREAVLARDDWQLLCNKLAISNTYSHAKNRNDLRTITLSKVPFPEVGFSAVTILGGGWLQSPASDGHRDLVKELQPIVALFLAHAWNASAWMGSQSLLMRNMCGMFPESGNSWAAWKMYPRMVTSPSLIFAHFTFYLQNKHKSYIGL